MGQYVERKLLLLAISNPISGHYPMVQLFSAVSHP
jgi:hypothetical protein